MNVLVTGGTGFVGSCFLEKLLDDSFFSGAEIYCLVRNPVRLKVAGRPRIHTLEGGSTDLHRFDSVIREADYIFHIAASATFQSGSYAESNVLFSEKLFEYARQSKKLKRLVFTSSIGAVDRLPNDPCDKPLDESFPPNPLTEYGRSKLTSEKLLAHSDLPFSIVRPSWVYGPGMRTNSHICVLIKSVLTSKLITLFDFPGKVSVIYVDDLAEALLCIAKSPKGARETFFVSDNQPVTIGAIFKIISDFLGLKSAGTKRLPKIFLASLARIRPFFPLAIQGLFASVLWCQSDKLFALGFHPRTEFREGLLKTIRWYVENHGQKK